jgi:hypothetical protein
MGDKSRRLAVEAAAKSQPGGGRSAPSAASSWGAEGLEETVEEGPLTFQEPHAGGGQ